MRLSCIPIVNACSGALVLMLLLSCTAFAIDLVTLKGKVFDNDGSTVKGAEIFVYDSSDTRRLADFISAPTDIQGTYKMTLPSGTYWVVARLRHGAKYGPLLPGDRHSGEPLEIEIGPEQEYEQAFTVMDLQDAARSLRKTREDYFKVQGRIADMNGKPVSNAFAVASRDKKISGIPDFISSWTGKDGKFVLYVPPGDYFIGYALDYPPASGYRVAGRVEVTTEDVDFNIATDVSAE